MHVNESGKRGFTTNPRYGLPHKPLTIPCGRCIGCRLERSRQWAIRCSHEASLYENNSFITLTFADAHLPPNNSLDVKIFQDFMKRLRKRVDGISPVWNEKKLKNDYPIRFFHCGEYGKVCKNCGKSKIRCICGDYVDDLGRPHYHACIFNYHFPDRYHWSTHNGFKYYRSPLLESLWTFGHSIIGDLTFESSAYVARYVTKKINGDIAAEHYFSHVDDVGEIIQKKPEYATMSRRPGIAKRWYEKFSDDVFPKDYILVNGKKCKPPKYYDNLLEKEHPMDYALIKEERKEKALSFEEDNTYERLQVKEEIQLKRNEKLKRGYEND